MSDDDEKIDVGEIEGINSSSSGLFGNSDRRAHHNALERKRRDHIKDSFYQLRDSIPQTTGEKISRASILSKATDFIKEMRDITTSNENVIETLRRENVVLEEQVKRLEEAKASGNVPADLDSFLDEAQQAALAKYSALNSVSKANNAHSRASTTHGDFKSGATGSGLVLNALATSQGLSQLVSSPSDHTYQGLSPAIKSDLTKHSLAALTTQLRNAKQQTSIQLSSASLAHKIAGAVGKVSTTIPPRGSGSIIIRTPAVANAIRQRGIVTATTVPISEGQLSTSNHLSSSQNAVSSTSLTSTQPASSTQASEGSQGPRPPQLAEEQQGSSKDATAVLQTLLSASPLELNAVLQNLLLSAASTNPVSLSDTQKTMISTLVALTGKGTSSHSQEETSEAAPSRIPTLSPANDDSSLSCESPSPGEPVDRLPTSESPPPSKKPRPQPEADDPLC